MPTTERVVEPTSQFRRDWKRESKGRYRTTLQNDFDTVLAMLRADTELPARYRDHQLGSRAIARPHTALVLTHCSCVAYMHQSNLP